MLLSYVILLKNYILTIFIVLLMCVILINKLTSHYVCDNAYFLEKIYVWLGFFLFCIIKQYFNDLKNQILKFNQHLHCHITHDLPTHYSTLHIRKNKPA
jgi:hypothetical protein